MGPQDAKRLGAAIRRHRIAAGLSQNKLAELADQQLERRASDGEKQTLRNSTILRLEDGKIRAPRPDLITAIAHVLNVDAADYFALAGYTTPNELPDLATYLRTKYPTLRQRDIKDLVTLVTERSAASTTATRPARARAEARA